MTDLNSTVRSAWCGVAWRRGVPRAGHCQAQDAFSFPLLFLLRSFYLLRCPEAKGRVCLMLRVTDGTGKEMTCCVNLRPCGLPPDSLPLSRYEPTPSSRWPHTRKALEPNIIFEFRPVVDMRPNKGNENMKNSCIIC